MALAVDTRADGVEDFDSPHRPDPAGGALAAGLRGAKLHREAGLGAEVDRVVKDDDSAVAEHGAGGGECLVVEAQVELGGRQVRAEWPAHLDGTHGPAAAGAAAESLDQIAEGLPKRGLDEAAAGHVAAELEHLGAARAIDPEGGIRLGSAGEDHGDGAQREDVVDDGGPTKEADEGRDGRFCPDLPAPAFDALEHRGFLAADVGASSDAHADVKREVASLYAAAEVPVGAGGVEGCGQHGDGIRVLGSDVDEAFACADRVRGDRHAFDE